MKIIWSQENKSYNNAYVTMNVSFDSPYRLLSLEISITMEEVDYSWEVHKGNKKKLQVYQR